MNLLDTPTACLFGLGLSAMVLISVEDQQSALHRKLNHSPGGKGREIMKSEQAPTTRACTMMTKAGTAITKEIMSTAAIDRALSTFADRLIAP